MPHDAYSFKLARTVGLLTEAEWAPIHDLLKHRARKIVGFRKETGCSLEDATRQEPNGQQALNLYEKLTGHRLDHPDQLWWVRNACYGRACPNCHLPFRTPRAKFCAECGYELPNGAVAGPFPSEEHT